MSENERTREIEDDKALVLATLRLGGEVPDVKPGETNMPVWMLGDRNVTEAVTDLVNAKVLTYDSQGYGESCVAVLKFDEYGDR